MKTSLPVSKKEGLMPDRSGNSGVQQGYQRHRNEPEALFCRTCWQKAGRLRREWVPRHAFRSGPEETIACILQEHELRRCRRVDGVWEYCYTEGSPSGLWMKDMFDLDLERAHAPNDRQE